jgi:hypothetical protein
LAGGARPALAPAWLIAGKRIDGRYEYAVGIATDVALLVVLVVLALPVVGCSPLPLLIK